MYIYRFVSRKKGMKETAKTGEFALLSCRPLISCLCLHCSFTIRSENTKMDETVDLSLFVSTAIMMKFRKRLKMALQMNNHSVQF